jgi:hypothetical protein
MTDRYNGWTNYETWCVNLWLSNDEGSSRYWNAAAEDAWRKEIEMIRARIWQDQQGYRWQVTGETHDYACELGSGHCETLPEAVKEVRKLCSSLDEKEHALRVELASYLGGHLLGLDLRIDVPNGRGGQAEADGTFSRAERARYDLADRLKGSLENDNPLAEQSNMWSDLLSAALSEVNWSEIADGILEGAVDEYETVASAD